MVNVTKCFILAFCFQNSISKFQPQPFQGLSAKGQRLFRILRLFRREFIFFTVPKTQTLNLHKPRYLSADILFSLRQYILNNYWKFLTSVKAQFSVVKFEFVLGHEIWQKLTGFKERLAY